ncbi:hypothetical protein [Paraburkholderia ginsengisoli]|uniref:Uncharacterized protein n=1 Tax=Paraburkholderia ginsengisoli TaxID=311231 RepID=A0A7T4N456_9BURK|nr:hypothetical protein [Paraburkholderia ginsengisoli]QQC64927.1 hypothetical protein I6I06_05505 [Paraburkholderia ginsengisoli]
MTSKKHHVSQPVEAPRSVESAESRLDEALEESFPASDPIAIDVTDPHHAAEISSKEKRRH